MEEVHLKSIFMFQEINFFLWKVSFTDLHKKQALDIYIDDSTSKFTPTF